MFSESDFACWISNCIWCLIFCTIFLFLEYVIQWLDLFQFISVHKIKIESNFASSWFTVISFGDFWLLMGLFPRLVLFLLWKLIAMFSMRYLSVDVKISSSSSSRREECHCMLTNHRMWAGWAWEQSASVHTSRTAQLLPFLVNFVEGWIALILNWGHSYSRWSFRHVERIGYNYFNVLI